MDDETFPQVVRLESLTYDVDFRPGVRSSGK
jgi:hypothetical protein